MIWAILMTIVMAASGAPGAADGCESGGMLPLLKRHEVQVLLRAGFGPADVAARVGVSVDTVMRVGAEGEVTHVDDAAERRRRQIGRPSKAAEFSARIRGWLAEDADLPTQELFRRALEAGYAGQKSALYSLVAALRPARAAPVVRFEGLPGEFSQHDFGHVDVRFVAGHTARVHFFASRLKYSRFVAVRLVDDERVETIVRSLTRHFAEFEGLPLLAVFDRPRTIVARSGKGREVEQYNATFAQAIVDIGVGVELCAPRSGNQKGTVERLVGWVKSAFFKPRKFQDLDDLRAQLADWVRRVNFETPSRATGVIPETRRQEELPRLRPLKVFPETLALRVPVFVGPTAEVMFEGAPYSMPPEAAHVAGTMFLYEDRLRIVAGRFSVEHRRRKKGEPPAPLPEHRAAKLAAVHGKRAKLYEMREQVLRLGPDALALLTELRHRSPALMTARVERLYALLLEHGDDRMRAAFRSAVETGNSSLVAVEEALRNLGARGGEGDVPHRGAAQPRGAVRSDSRGGDGRAAPKGGRA